MSNTTIVVGYFWVAIWTGLLVLGQYTPEEPTHKKVIGPIMFGAMWPIFLPVAVLGHHGPQDYGIGQQSR